MLDETLQKLTEADSFAAIAFLSAQEDVFAAVNVCSDLVRQIYREQKDVPAMLMIGRAGIQLGLDRAARETDTARANAIKGKAKEIAYNAAVNAWPGWEDDGVTITASDIALGLDLAKTNLRLAIELERDDLLMSRAYWAVGALHLAAGNRDAAKPAFERAAQLARAADETGEALLSDGFAALVDVLGGGDEAPLVAVLAALDGIEHGAFFKGQIEASRRVFA